MRIIAALALALTLTGCGIAQRIQSQEQAKQQAALNAQLAAQSDAAIADCNSKLPSGNPKTIVARMKCLNDAAVIRMPTFGSDQDLVQAFMAERMVVAEQVEKGKMTIAEGNAVITEKWSRAVSESSNGLTPEIPSWHNKTRQRHNSKLRRRRILRRELR